MSRKSKRRSRTSLGGRDFIKPRIPIANRRLPRQSIRSFNQVLLDLARLSGQDQRRFLPHKKLMPARTVTGMIAPTKIKKHVPLRLTREKFINPKAVTICVRRSMRKEVLHAIGKSGLNRGRNYRRNQWSDVSC